MHIYIINKIDINALNLYTRSCIELNPESIPVSEPRSAPGNKRSIRRLSYP